MTNDTAPQHWETVYRSKAADTVSWFRPHLDMSLALLRASGFGAGAQLIDVGGGASTLVDDLLEQRDARITVLDLSDAALEIARRRLGARAADVEWRVGDITSVDLPAGGYSHWHDRAVLHFLTEDAAAQAYAVQAARAVAVGGHAVIGGFAPDGPERCSGLTVARRSPQQVATLLGAAFELVDAREERHRTPGGAEQAFAWAVLRRR